MGALLRDHLQCCPTGCLLWPDSRKDLNSSAERLVLDAETSGSSRRVCVDFLCHQFAVRHVLQ